MSRRRDDKRNKRFGASREGCRHLQKLEKAHILQEALVRGSTLLRLECRPLTLDLE